MKMKKKRLIIALIIIIALVILKFALSNSPNREPITGNYDKQQKINDFVANEKGTDPKKNIDTNEGGYKGVILKNKQALQKTMSTDEMLVTGDKINEALNFIQKLHDETKGLSDADLSKYYNQNTDTINSIFGITDEGGFKNLMSKFSFIGENDSLKEAEIQDNSAIKDGTKAGEVKFSLSIKSSSDKEQIFNIAALVNESNPKDVTLNWN
ncbi:hypothetical protein [uncultured Clostridium sp.]|uniref:hypothetical protein n=1 Tax=uncultured Clostridium sp. TaxID=59620 RepID=UPI0028EF9553|nr:hypothetical protein [uncultured Clostridium sp.]